jgi:hypothetical protein
MSGFIEHIPGSCQDQYGEENEGSKLTDILRHGKLLDEVQ